MIFDNININLIIIYILLGIIIISIITLFITFSKNKKSNEISENSFNIPSNLTLDNLKVKNIEVEENLISPSIQTDNLYSTNTNEPRYSIKINSSIELPNKKTSLITPQIYTDGIVSNIVGKFKNVLIDNGYIKDFGNDKLITLEELNNRTNEDKEKYNQRINN